MRQGSTRDRGGRDRRRTDGETRRRLLDAAAQLFAERGYWAVTVRDVCRAARANVAAVNYHFGDKLGLYREVVEETLGAAFAVDPTLDAPPGSSAEERLRHFVHAYVPRIAKPDGPTVRARRLMSHEVETPTPLAPWIAQRIIVPRLRFLSEAVAELLGCPVTDRRVGRCVMSLQAQCIFYLPNRFRRAALPEWDRAMSADLAQAADHITEFTLGGIARLTRS